MAWLGAACVGSCWIAHACFQPCITLFRFYVQREPPAWELAFDLSSDKAMGTKRRACRVNAGDMRRISKV